MDSVTQIHASAFIYGGTGCLLLGESGCGKSHLLAEAIAHGARMIADDQVGLKVVNHGLVAVPVPHLKGVLELRGLGLVQLPDVVMSHPIHLAVSLQGATCERMPPPTTKEFLGISVPHLALPLPPTTTAPSLLLYMKAMQVGRILPPDWHPKV